MTQDAKAKSLRILHIGKYYPPHRGGMETVLRDLVTAQRAQGHTVAVLVHRSKPSLIDYRDQKDPYIVRAARWFNLSVVPVSPTFMLTAFRMIADFKPDVIHIHHPNSSAAWLLLLPSARRIPWVATWHSDIKTAGASDYVSAAAWLYRPLEWLQLRNTKAIMATSPPYLEHSDALAVFRERCLAVPLGLDFKRLPAGKPDRPAPPFDRQTVLTVGRNTYYKGIDTLIHACAYIPSLHIEVVGSSEAENTDLLELAKDLGVRHRVHFLGKLSAQQLALAYAHCDVFCLPSKDKTEAFGMVTLEAAFYGCPIVVTDIPGSGVPWVAEQLGALIAEPNNPIALAAALAQSLGLAVPIGKKRFGAQIEHTLSEEERQRLHVDMEQREAKYEERQKQQEAQRPALPTTLAEALAELREDNLMRLARGEEPELSAGRKHEHRGEEQQSPSWMCRQQHYDLSEFTIEVYAERVEEVYLAALTHH